MTILYLGPERPAFEAFLASTGDMVRRRDEPIRLVDLPDPVDWIISYGYRHVVRADVIEPYRGRILNLHIAYLPWNRGADPNLWSFLDDTPKGVTIHQMDEGLDTGPIVAQRLVESTHDDTLRTMYVKLSAAIEALFIESWPILREGRLLGSCHRSADKAAYAHLLNDHGWDTPVALIRGRALRRQS